MEDVGRVKKVRRFFKKYLSPSVKRNRFFTEGRNLVKIGRIETLTVCCQTEGRCFKKNKNIFTRTNVNEEVILEVEDSSLQVLFLIMSMII